MRRTALVAVTLGALILTGAPAAQAAHSPSGAATGTWTEVNPEAPWEARAGLQAVQLRNKIFILGGRTPATPEDPAFGIPGASTLHNDVWSTRDQGRSWRQVKADGDTPWAERGYFQAVTTRGRMVVLGGQDFRAGADCPPGVTACSQFFNDVWTSWDGSRWRQATEDAGWVGRAGLSAAVLKNEIYVFGGSYNDDSAIVGGSPARVYLNDVWKSRDLGRTWTQVTADAPWQPRAGAATAVKDGYLYLFGGEAGFTCESVEGGPGGPPAGALGEAPPEVGGGPPGGPPPGVGECELPYFNDVWRTKNGSDWELVTEAAGWTARPGHQCVVLNREFVCFGGFGLPTNPTDMWASRDGRTWREISAPVWNATSPDDAKYDFDALVVRSGSWWGKQSILTFGGDRETFDFGDPLNYTRVDNDVWRYSPDRTTGRSPASGAWWRGGN